MTQMHGNISNPEVIREEISKAFNEHAEILRQESTQTNEELCIEIVASVLSQGIQSFSFPKTHQTAITTNPNAKTD